MIFDDGSAGVGQIAELEWQDVAIPDQGRAQTGAEPEKKHAAAAITSERLHGGVVDDPNRFAEQLCAKSIRASLGRRCFGFFVIRPFVHRGRESRSRRRRSPSLRPSLQSGSSSRVGVMRGPELNFRFSVREIISFTWRAADIDDEDLFLHARSFVGGVMIGDNFSAEGFCVSARFCACLRDRSRKCSCACERGWPSSVFRRT